MVTFVEVRVAKGASEGLNLERLAFPTDQVTFGEIRRRQPHLFMPAGAVKANVIEIDLAAAAAMEHELAAGAFAKARGQVDPLSKAERRELLTLLDTEYRKYGLASGLRQTQELVRRLEQSAATQGRATEPPRR